MRALALSLVLALALPAWADDVPPVGGTLTPDALCLDSREQVTLAKRLESDAARIKSLEASLETRPGTVPVAVVVVVAVVGVLAAGAAAAGGYAAGQATAKPTP